VPDTAVKRLLALVMPDESSLSKEVRGD
jgi:hypothetical protein